MNAEQQAQWDQYGCVPRCIIKLAEISGKPISVDAFIERFEPQCSQWHRDFGLLTWDECFAICRQLKIASHFLPISDITLFRHGLSINAYSHAFVCTKLDENPPGHWYTTHHCHLFCASGSDYLSLYDPITMQSDRCYSVPDWFLIKQELSFIAIV